MSIEIGVYWAVLSLIAAAFWYWDRARERRARENVAEAERIGSHIPVSLHPRIDPERCIGTAACAMACPEKTILEIVGGRAVLAHAAHCVGHGACYSACPVDAIRLVIGSEQRGVEIPHIRPNFETNRRGVYITGELGGMGLIANAVQQGVEAADYIDADLAEENNGRVSADADVAVIGAGPAGVAAALRLRQLGRSLVWVDRLGIGGAINVYSRHKVVMTRPFRLPGGSLLRRREYSKPQLARYFEQTVQHAGIEPEYGEMVDIHGEAGAFRVQLADGRAKTVRRVLLALGRRGNPRRLGVPGEDLPCVTYT